MEENKTMSTEDALRVLHDAELSHEGVHYLLGILSVDVPEALASAVEFVKKQDNSNHFEGSV